MKAWSRFLLLLLVAVLPVRAVAQSDINTYRPPASVMPLKTYGSPTFLGVIVATTTKNNADTAAPFNSTGRALKGMVLLVQPDVACYVIPGTVNTVTVTASNGVKLEANQLHLITMLNDEGWLAALPVSGTCNLKVWELR